MAQNRTQAKIIPFPTRAGEERKEPLVLERRETPCLPWPPGPLDRFELPEQERVRWLDEALVAARVRELSFLRALAQIAPTALRPEMVSGPLMRFHEAARHLTL
jgi:hypothetical protein